MLNYKLDTQYLIKRTYYAYPAPCSLVASNFLVAFDFPRQFAKHKPNDEGVK